MGAVLKSKHELKEIYPVQEEGKPMAETPIHLRQILYLVDVLDVYFVNQPVLVGGDMTFYYEENNPKKWIAPDVFVAKDVEPDVERRVFKLWDENAPVVVFEISSRSTWGEDLNRKWKIYEAIGVREYYIFDPEYDYLTEPLVAYRLNVKGELNKIAVRKNRVFSPALNLEIVDTGSGLRLYNPETKELLNSFAEEREAHLREQEGRLREREGRLRAEAELEKMREEISRLQKGGV